MYPKINVLFLRCTAFQKDIGSPKKLDYRRQHLTCSQIHLLCLSPIHIFEVICYWLLPTNVSSTGKVVLKIR